MPEPHRPGTRATIKHRRRGTERQKYTRRCLFFVLKGAHQSPGYVGNLQNVSGRSALNGENVNPPVPLQQHDNNNVRNCHTTPGRGGCCCFILFFWLFFFKPQTCLISDSHSVRERRERYISVSGQIQGHVTRSPSAMLYTLLFVCVCVRYKGYSVIISER